MDLVNYVDNGIKYTIDNHESISFPISTTYEKPVRKQTRYAAQTPEWIVQCVRHNDVPRAITVLRTWVPLSREREISENLVKDIRKLKMMLRTRISYFHFHFLLLFFSIFHIRKLRTMIVIER